MIMMYRHIAFRQEECGSICCCMLQCIAVCSHGMNFSMLLYVVVRCSVFTRNESQYIAVCCGVFTKHVYEYVAVCCNALQCVYEECISICYSALQCVAVCLRGIYCSMLRYVAVRCRVFARLNRYTFIRILPNVAIGTCHTHERVMSQKSLGLTWHTYN